MRLVNEVIYRDNYKCTLCGSRSELYVHNKNKVEEPSVDDLITVCANCHENIHGYQFHIKGEIYEEVSK